MRCDETTSRPSATLRMVPQNSQAQPIERIANLRIEGLTRMAAAYNLNDTETVEDEAPVMGPWDKGHWANRS